MPNKTYFYLLSWLFGLTFGVSAAFLSFPQLDIFVSGLFFNDGFWLKDLTALNVIRQGLIDLMLVFALGTLALFLWALYRKAPLRRLGFGLATMLLGPLLLVNTVLKNNWGRARPQDITVFGGDSAFTPAYLFTDQCSTNCSFTSGEGAAIATVAFLIAFNAWPVLAAKWQKPLLAGLSGLVLVGAGLRVVMGQHFLSDTLLSVLFCALVAAGLYRLFFPDNSFDYRVNYQFASAKLAGPGLKVTLAVPTAASHRPAVEAFLQGKYYEAFSHRSFYKILAHKGGNAVHAGAFFGDMLHTLSQHAEQVYAFEPVLDNYVLAKQNIARLGLKNVVLFNAALGREAGFATMRVRGKEGEFLGGASAIRDIKPQAGITETVPVFALDRLPIDHISLLHLDVEGQELNVLLGAKTLITHSKPIILLEDNRKSCAPLLEELGYRFCFFRNSLNYWAMPDDTEFVKSLEPH